MSAQTNSTGEGSRGDQPLHPPQGTAPHPAPSTGGDIPLTESTLAQSRQRKWMESFGIALLPVLAVVLARIIAPTGHVDVLNPVDLCFAMLPATVVVIVQLWESSKINPSLDIMPRVIVLIIFTVAFSIMAVLNAYLQGQKADTLDLAANAAVGTLGSASRYVESTQPKSELSTYELKFNLANSENALKKDSRSAAQSENNITSLVTALLISGAFLGYSFRFVWSRL